MQGAQTLFAPFFNLLGQYQTVLNRQGSIAVATGRNSAAELREAGADAVLADLTDAAGLLRLLING